MVFEKYPHCVQFEDNLSSHKTPEVLAFWETIKCSQILYPPDLTHVLQPVDRHIGIQYKTAVYKAVRSRSMELLRADRQPTNTKLSAMEKRIIITKAVAETHIVWQETGHLEEHLFQQGLGYLQIGLLMIR